MIIGFTGTRLGMSLSQRAQFNRVFPVLCNFVTSEFHHGGAYGADTEAWHMVLAFGMSPEYIHWHPCPGVVATEETLTHHWHEVLLPLRRNKEIVNESAILIAAPSRNEEELWSGTWATIRYARTKGIPVVMLSR